MWFINRLLPHSLIGRLTLMNVVIITVVITASSLAVYNSACFLAEGLGDLTQQRQLMFNQTLANYLIAFVVATVVAGGLLHFYLTKKLIKPVRELIESTKQMRTGQYPEPLTVKSTDELGQFIEQYNALIAQLQQNDQTHQKLVQDLSHEFRTPLSNLNGYLKAMANGDIDGDPAIYEALYEESGRLTAMVEQLDKLKEWDHLSDHTAIEREQVQMNTIVTKSTAMFDWVDKEKDINIDVSVIDKEMWVNQDGIVQVISNLLDNALQYYEGDGAVKVTGRPMTNGYQIIVSGPSQPIPNKQKERIFERFYRVDESRSRETGGSGLGLSIAREIVLQHHGDIYEHSREQDGITAFTVELPDVRNHL